MPTRAPAWTVMTIAPHATDRLIAYSSSPGGLWHVRPCRVGDPATHAADFLECQRYEPPMEYGAV